MSTKGYQCATYVRTSGSHGTPTWTEVLLINDMAVDDPKEKLEADSRSANGMRKYEPGRTDLTVTGQIRKDASDTAYAAIASAFAGRTELDVMILDGKKDANGSIGYRLGMKVFKFSEDQAAGKVLYKDFEMAPCPSDNPWQTVLVTAGAPVFTDGTLS